MTKKCPVNTLCIDKTTLAIVTIGLLCFAFIFQLHQQTQKHIAVAAPRDVNVKVHLKQSDHHSDRFEPPRYRMPINISTSYEQVRFQQVGMLRRQGEQDSLRERETILALYGRPLHRSRSKWQYYTMTDKNQGIKLPMSFKGKQCDSTYGCDEIFTGDIVHVDGYNDEFLVTIYDTQVLEYI
jgi:hypothetical protein